MTTPEALAQVLCESAPVTELYSGEVWSDLHPVEQGHWIELARAILAHLGEGREQESGCRAGEAECLTHGQWLTHCAAGLRAQAAAHAEDVRKIQTRMLAMKEVVERARAYLVIVGNDDAELDALVDSLAAYDALAETDGRATPETP